jgi:hypothetical protein
LKAAIDSRATVAAAAAAAAAAAVRSPVKHERFSADNTSAVNLIYVVANSLVIS